ncbi:MAG: hypothetical protein IID42_02485 [Planctomycetes bacterium]|nr:hypothetical protein [Planctomycetota bacterium]
MPGLFDKSEIELTCPRCHRKFKAPIAEMRLRPKFPCPKCGYDLKGLAMARCPECGTEFTLDELFATWVGQGSRLDE